MTQPTSPPVLRPTLEDILAAVRAADADGPLPDTQAESLSGLSGRKTVGLLQRLVRLFEYDPTACYVEIGVFQGLTLVTAGLAAPRLPCFGIDNFATLDPLGTNLGIVRERLTRLRVANASLINEDFEAALAALDAHLGGRRIAVYFIDGPHDYRSQLVCLLHARRLWHERAVIVIDDANYPDVRWSTRDFLLAAPDVRLAFEAYSPAHPANMTEDERHRWEAGWLNGVQVLVRDPDHRLPDMLPPVDGDRTLYFNEWLVHRLRLAELAPEALALAQAVCGRDGAAEAAVRNALLAGHAAMAPRLAGRFADRNVYSGGLPEGRYNKMKW